MNFVASRKADKAVHVDCSTSSKSAGSIPEVEQAHLAAGKRLDRATLANRPKPAMYLTRFLDVGWPKSRSWSMWEFVYTKRT